MLGLAGLTNMNIALTLDIQRLLRKKVENGQFSNEEAVIEAALRHFLLEDPGNEQPPMRSATEPQRQSEDGTQPPAEFTCLSFRKRFYSRRKLTFAPSSLPNGVREE